MQSFPETSSGQCMTLTDIAKEYNLHPTKVTTIILAMEIPFVHKYGRKLVLSDDVRKIDRMLRLVSAGTNTK